MHAIRLLVASALLAGSMGFEQLAGFKMPSLQNMQKAISNKQTFGDKKIVVVTGTSSGRSSLAPFCACKWLSSIIASTQPFAALRPSVSHSVLDCPLTGQWGCEARSRTCNCEALAAHWRVPRDWRSARP